jgi:hypothetical protein
MAQTIDATAVRGFGVGVRLFPRDAATCYSDKHGVFRVSNKDAVAVTALHGSAAHCRN